MKWEGNRQSDNVEDVRGSRKRALTARDWCAASYPAVQVSEASAHVEGRVTPQNG